MLRTDLTYVTEEESFVECYEINIECCNIAFAVVRVWLSEFCGLSAILVEVKCLFHSSQMEKK
jgi:hypothetical protein